MTIATISAPPSAWKRALKVLQKPLAPVAPQPPAKAGPKFVAVPSWAAAQHEAEEVYLAALNERNAAQRSIATHGERREAMLLDPGSDDSITALGLEIDRANATLGRLDVVLPDMLTRLGQIKMQAREERLGRWREKYAPRFAAFADDEAAYLARRAEWQTEADACAAEFLSTVYTEHKAGAPDVREIIPHLAPLRPYVESFAEQIAKFSEATLIPKQAPPHNPFTVSLADFIEGARMSGQVHPDCPLAWRPAVERALLSSVKVELLADYIDGDGRTHEKGAEIELPPDVAEDKVSRGRAIYRGQ